MRSAKRILTTYLDLVHWIVQQVTEGRSPNIVLQMLLT